MIKAMTTRTGATAVPPRSPRIKRGVDTGEAEPGVHLSFVEYLSIYDRTDIK